MGSALGNPSARAAGGSRTFDIRDFGAVPGYYNAAQTRKAIQAAIDANASDLVALHTVLVPSGDWFVDRPVMIDRHINLVGDQGATLNGIGETTPLVVGIPRQGYVRTMPLAAVHLDGSAGAAFTGLYLDPGEHACIPFSPFSNALAPNVGAGTVDSYQITDEVTVEWQQDLSTNPLYAGPVMGMSNGLHAAPWVIGFISYNFNSSFLGLSSGGSGYTSAPTVNVAVSGGGGGVAMTAAVANGSVTGLTVTNPGTGIQPSSAATITFSGGGGTGAAATIAPSIYGAPTIAGGMQVVIATADGSKWGLTQRYFFGLPGGLTGLTNFAVTMSPKQGTIAVWVNGVRQGLLGGSAVMPAAGSKFQPNLGVPFQIGAEDVAYSGVNGTIFTASPPGVTTLNRNFTGLRYWVGAPYVLTGAAGSAQTRGDAKPLDPGAAGSRYKTQEAGVIAWLPFTDAPADVLAYRQFTVMYGSGTLVSAAVNGYLVSNAMVGNFDWQPGSIRDLTFRNGGKYSPALILGYTVDYEIRDVTAAGGVHAIGEFITGANYTLKLSGFTQLSSADISLFLYFCTLEQTGQLNFTNYGRACVVASSTSTLRFTFIYVIYPMVPALWLFKVGNYLQIDQLLLDFEGYIPNLKTGIWMDAVDLGGAPEGINCLLGNVNGGDWPAQASLVYIDESDAGGGFGEFKLDNLSLYSSGFRAVVEVSGKSARGEFFETQEIAAPWILNSTPDGLGNIRCTKRLDGLPRRGTFATHSSIIKANHPADGQFTEFRCTGGGSYQTGSPGSPPRWTGISPLDDSGAGLATYVQANPAWTSGNAAAQVGPVGELAASQFLNGYLGVGNLTAGGFSAGVPAPPASLVACLISDPVGTMTETVNEAYGGGYARQPITFGASVAGVASNNAAVTFPALTATVGTITGVQLRNAANNTIMAQIPVNPILTTVGTVVSFAAGTLTIRPVPVPAGGTLGPQMGYVGTQVYDTFNNFYLRGTAYTPPAGLQFALSTAPASRSAPTEPVGNGYARVAAGPFLKALGLGSQASVICGVTGNSAAVTFGAPTGPWGTIRSVYLLDGAGNVIFSGNVTIPRAFASGSPAPTIPAGAFWVAW